MAASLRATAAARQREASGCRWNLDGSNQERGEPPLGLAIKEEAAAGVDHLTRDRALAAGATGFIPKPFTEPELRAEVAAVLQGRPALVDHPA
jgi:CheY-like chemotaxis protein